MLVGTDVARAERFVEELTELSRKHGVGIADEPTLFMLEAEDADREYRIDDESRLVY